MNNFQQNKNPLIRRNEGINIEDSRGQSDELFIGIYEEISPQEDKFISLKRHEIKYFDCGHAAWTVSNIGGICPSCERSSCPECLERCSKCGRIFCSFCLKKDKNGDYYCKKHAITNSFKNLVMSLVELPLKLLE